MGKNNAPTIYTPPPDYSGVVKAAQESAKYSYDLGKEQLAWAKEQYAQDRGVADRVIDQAMSRAQTEDANAATDRARYEHIFQPLEEQLSREGEQYTPERNRARAEEAAGRAAAGVSSQFGAARQAAQDRLESFGIDPSQTRAQALDLSARMQEAAARAGAANAARDQTQAREEATGRALRSEAINVGRGYPGQIAQTYGTALQSGNQAVNSGIATTATGANTMGTPVQWQGLGNQAVGTWGNTLNQGFQNQLDANKSLVSQLQARQSSSSGVGSALGLLGGLGMKAFSGGLFAGGGPVDDELAEGGQDNELAEGEGVGTMVDPALSPSGGANTDDVPARLNAGEFVIPRDVVAWKGQEWLQKLIINARQASQSQAAAPAQPERRALPVEAPAVDTDVSPPIVPETPMESRLGSAIVQGNMILDQADQKRRARFAPIYGEDLDRAMGDYRRSGYRIDGRASR